MSTGLTSASAGFATGGWPASLTVQPSASASEPSSVLACSPGREHGQRGVRDRGVFGEHGDGARAAVVQEREHAVRLHGEREVAAVVAHARVLGHERLRRNRPQQRMLGEVHVEHGLVITGVLRTRRHDERRHAAPRAPQSFDVHVGDGESLAEWIGLREHAAVFGDDLLTADRHVARRIALAGAAVRIAAQQARALTADQPAAVEILLE